MDDLNDVEGLRADNQYQQIRSCVEQVAEQISEDDEVVSPSVQEMVEFLTQPHIDISPSHFALVASEMVNGVVYGCIKENPDKADLIRAVILGGGVGKDMVSLLQLMFLAGASYSRRNTLVPALLSNSLTRNGKELLKFQQEGTNVRR